MELKAFSLLRPCPVHKETELAMDHCDGYEHIAKDSVETDLVNPGSGQVAFGYFAARTPVCDGCR
jgi:hypothetical protein